MTTYHISIKDLEVQALIGAHPHERQAPQPLKISLEIETDFTKAIHTDHLTDTVDYDQIITIITKIATQTSYTLLESLANEMRDEIRAFPMVKTCSVKLEKPNISPITKSISIIIRD